MNEVYFDIIDKSCNIIGKATRKECHGNRSLAHCVVHVLVFNNKGELYLQKRSITRVFQLATYSKEKRFFAIAQNDNSRSAVQRKNCHPERSEGSF